MAHFFAGSWRALRHKRGFSNFFITFKGAKFLLTETIFSYYYAFCPIVKIIRIHK